MVDARNIGLALGREAREHEARARTQVARHHRRAVQWRATGNNASGALSVDLRAHARQLGNMHKSLGVNLLGDHRVSLRKAEQRHELRLQVGRKSRVGLGGDLRWLELALAGHAHGCVHRIVGAGEKLDMHADLAEAVNHRQHPVVRELLEGHIAVGYRRGHRVGSGDDAVGNHDMVRRAKALDAMNHQARSAGALDAGSHGVEQIGEVDHFWLAGRTFDDGPALGQHCGAHHIGGAENGRAVGATEEDGRALQAFWRGHDDVTAVELDLGAERLHSAEMEVNRPRAEGATTRHGDDCAATARQQRTEHANRRAHGLDDVVVRVNLVLVHHPHLHHPGLAINLNTELAQQPSHVRNVAETRDIAQRDLAVGTQRRRHERQSRVLGALDLNLAGEPASTLNTEGVHVCSNPLRALRTSSRGPGVVPHALCVLGVEIGSVVMSQLNRRP